MKKLLVLMMTFCMVFGLCSCGDQTAESGDTANTETGDDAVEESTSVADLYHLDLTSTEIQPMSDEKATSEVLSETTGVWLGGMTMFSDTDYADYTYEDFVAHIGVDATEFYYDDTENAEVYSWIPFDGIDANSKLSVWFQDGHLKYLGSVNL